MIGITSDRIQLNYDPALDAFRLGAALLVMFSHYFARYLDVHVYYQAYSALMLAAGYFAYQYARHRYSGKAYLITRLTRLYPAYLIAVLAYWFALQEASSFTGRTLVNHLLFLITATEKAQVFALNPAFWVLPAFVEFYLLFALFGKKIHAVRLLVIGLLLVVPLRILAVPELRILRLHIPYYLYIFALGGCVAALREKLLQWPWRRVPPLLAASGAFLLLLVIGSDKLLFGVDVLEPLGIPEFREPLFVLLYAITLFALLYSNRDVFAFPWLRLLAGACFSIYLFHNLFSVLLPSDRGWTAIFFSALSTTITAIFVQAVVENPIRKWAKERTLKAA